MQHSTGQTRRALLSRLFPDGIPTLWCPPITHYTADRGIDRERTAAHLASIAPYVKGLLSAGSTGDGWQMTGEQWTAVTQLAVDAASKHRMKVLVGVLKADFAEQVEALRSAAKWLGGSAGPSAVNRLAGRNICAFTVCPPHGAELTEAEIEFAIRSYLDLGIPLALYQLPQVTRNEMAPELVYAAALKYDNFVLFKDTSGTDKVALYRRRRGDVCLLRGAEGDYARWYSAGGGPYHGFLLSTGNCFGRQLREILEALKAGRPDEARVVSERLSAVVAELFSAVKDVNDGNAFANSNKAADHFMAWGPRAAEVPPPFLNSGNRLPAEVIRSAGGILQRHGFMPVRGYLE